MEIELHPSAAKRFDELGDELLNRVVACDAAESRRPTSDDLLRETPAAVKVRTWAD